MYDSAIRKNDYPTFAATWMGLEGIMLNEVSQAKKDNYLLVSVMCGTYVIAQRTIGEGRET